MNNNFVGHPVTRVQNGGNETSNAYSQVDADKKGFSFALNNSNSIQSNSQAQELTKMEQSSEGGISSNELEHALLESIFYNEMMMMDDMNSMFSLPGDDDGSIHGNVTTMIANTSSSSSARIGEVQIPNSHNHGTNNGSMNGNSHLKLETLQGQILVDIEPNHVPQVQQQQKLNSVSRLNRIADPISATMTTYGKNQNHSQTHIDIQPKPQPGTIMLQHIPTRGVTVPSTTTSASTANATGNHTNTSSTIVSCLNPHPNGNLTTTISSPLSVNINGGNNNIVMQQSSTQSSSAYAPPRYQIQRGIKHNVKPKGNTTNFHPTMTTQILVPASAPTTTNHMMNNGNVMNQVAAGATCGGAGIANASLSRPVMDQVYYTNTQQGACNLVGQGSSHVQSNIRQGQSPQQQYPQQQQPQQQQQHPQQPQAHYQQSQPPSQQQQPQHLVSHPPSAPINIAPAPQPTTVSLQHSNSIHNSQHHPISILPQPSSNNNALQPIAPAPPRDQYHPPQQQQYTTQTRSLTQNPTFQHAVPQQQQQSQQYAQQLQPQLQYFQQQQLQTNTQVLQHQPNTQLLQQQPPQHTQFIQQPQAKIQQPQPQSQPQQSQPLVQQQLQPLHNQPIPVQPASVTSSASVGHFAQNQTSQQGNLQRLQQPIQHVVQPTAVSLSSNQIHGQQPQIQHTQQLHHRQQQQQLQHHQQQQQQQQIQQQQHQYHQIPNHGNISQDMKNSGQMLPQIQSESTQQCFDPAPPSSSSSTEQPRDGLASRSQVPPNTHLPRSSAAVSSLQQAKANQLVSQFHTLASRLGISLPANVLNDLTTVAIMNESASVGDSSAAAASSSPIDLTLEGTHVPSNVLGNDSLVTSSVSCQPLIPSYMKQLQDTAEAAITAVESHKRKSVEQDVYPKTSPAPVRRKRKPTKEDCERTLSQLKAENETLKRHLDMVKNKTARFEAERKAQEKKMKELVMLSSKRGDDASWEKELRENLAQFTETYSDYGKHRQEELFFHLNQLEKLAAPTTFTKMSLWTLGQNESFFTNPNNHPISGILKKELEITPAQGKKILAQRSKIQKLCNNIKEVLQLIADLKALCQKKQKVFSDRMTKCQEILTPEQVTRLLVWIDDNSSVLDKLCPGWGSERIRGQNLSGMVGSLSLPHDSVVNTDPSSEIELNSSTSFNDENLSKHSLPENEMK